MSERVAILIDGGYFLKRLPSVQRHIDVHDAEAVCLAIKRLVHQHLKTRNKIARAGHPRSLLYRTFFYDAWPYDGFAHTPVSKKAVKYRETETYKFRVALFERLRTTPNLALRLGEVRMERTWILREEPQKKLLKGDITVADLTDEDFDAGLRQKTVDIRIGVDIASLALKDQVDTIILVTGDSDFVPAAKLARREGVKIILDPLWRSVAPELFEHIDGLTSGFPKPSRKGAPDEAAALDPTADDLTDET